MIAEFQDHENDWIDLLCNELVRIVTEVGQEDHALLEVLKIEGEDLDGIRETLQMSEARVRRRYIPVLKGDLDLIEIRSSGCRLSAMGRMSIKTLLERGEPVDIMMIGNDDMVDLLIDEN